MDRRDAAIAQLHALDASQAARRLPLRAEIQLFDALLTGDGPGDDEEFRASLEGFLDGKWHVERALSEPAMHGEALSLLTLLQPKIEGGS